MGVSAPTISSIIEQGGSALKLWVKNYFNVLFSSIYLEIKNTFLWIMACFFFKRITKIIVKLCIKFIFYEMFLKLCLNVYHGKPSFFDRNFSAHSSTNKKILLK